MTEVAVRAGALDRPERIGSNGQGLDLTLDESMILHPLRRKGLEN